MALLLAVFVAGFLAGRQWGHSGLLRGYRTRNVVFAGPHTFTLKGTVTWPEPFIGRKYPAILFIHGLLPRGAETRLYKLLTRELAKRGFLVLSFDMRGFDDSSEVANFRVPQDLDFLADVKAALSFMIRELPVDKRNITIAGHSMGANLAFAVGAKDARVRNIIAVSAGNFGPVWKYTGVRKKQMLGRFDHVLGTKLNDRQWKHLAGPLDMFQYLPLEEGKRVSLIVADGDWPHIRLYSKRLYKKLKVAKEFVVIRDSNHNFGAEYQKGNTIVDTHPVAVLARRMTEWARR